MFCIHYLSFQQSSGSGSESGIQTQKPDKLKSGESDNDTGSNYENDIESTGSNARDGSDNGSSTQVTLSFSSCCECSFLYIHGFCKKLLIRLTY